VTSLPAWADVRGAARLDGGYMHRVRKRRAWSPRMIWLGRAVKWGVPASLPAIAALPDAAAGTMIFAFLLLVAVGSGAGGKAVKLDAVLALRMPSRRALAVARLLVAAPYLLWCGLGVAVTVVVHADRLAAGSGATAWLFAAACLLLAPVQALRKASGAAWDKTGKETAAGGCLAGLVVYAFLLWGFGWHDRNVLRWVGLATLYAFAFRDGARSDRFAGGAPRIAADVVWAFLAVAAAVTRESDVASLPPASLLAAAVYLVVWPLVASPLLLRETMRDVELMEVGEKEEPGTSSAPKWTLPAGWSAPHRRPGRGLWSASWERWRRMETPGPLLTTGTGWERLWDFVATLFVWAVQVFRVTAGPILAMAAVVMPPRIGLLGAALACGAAFAARTFVAGALDPRLHLCGVDYVAQVRHELRALLLVAFAPTMAVALAAGAAVGFTPTAAFGCAAVASMSVLRIGWPGISGERERIGPLGCVGIVAAVLLLVFLPRTAESGFAVVSAAAVVGVAGLVRRMRRLDETLLRDEMRADAESGGD
jgi:hypothetical protein